MLICLFDCKELDVRGAFLTSDWYIQMRCDLSKGHKL